MMSSRRFRGFGGVVLAGVLALGLAAGCSSKKKDGDAYDPAAGTAGIGEKGISDGSSLRDYQKGTLGEGQDEGPLKNVYFDFDAYELSGEAREILKANAEWLRANPTTRVEIEGHTDSRGTVEYNLALGARRARAAKDFLQTSGISSDRMTTISYGKELPLCQEETDSCWAQNRRVHFVVLNR